MRRLVVLLALLSGVSCQNCRGEEYRPRACENMCEEDKNCTVRAALLLPANTIYDAALPIVKPVLELALQSVMVRDVFPSWVNFEWQAYDVTDCDAAYAVISAIDAYNDCAHVFFGPACDFALASVGRITKFLGSSGIPIITTGGFTFDFVAPKQTCDDEFYMLVRTGPLGFKDLAYFIIGLMRNFDWRQLLLITEPDAQLSVAGNNTCYLMMKTLANFLKKEDLMYTPWDTTSDGGKNYTENLKFHLGYKYTNRLPQTADLDGYRVQNIHSFQWGRAALLYDTSAYISYVGSDGGFLAASTLHNFLITEGFDIFGWGLQLDRDLKEQLLQYVGLNYASKCGNIGLVCEHALKWVT